jgi:single-strand DNA-binding protein
MKGLNKVTLVGNVGEDPRMNQTKENMSVANFSLATNENYTDKDGKPVEKTEWHHIVVWNKQAEVVQKYVKKGDPLFVEGRIRTSSWEDKEGNKRFSTEIFCDNFLFLSSRKNN